VVGVLAAVAMVQAQATGWVSLFNGKDLTGWVPKIRGYDLGVNFGDTFRVKDGVIQVSYDQYGGKFEGRFGHLFYEKPFSEYILRLEYRFTGDQMPDGASWAYRNSGIMLHCQDPKTMRKDQDFPVSCEFQLLGGPPEGDRPTGNVCTPGTNIHIDDKLVTQHCTNSTSDTFRGDQWVKAEVEVRGNGRVIHRINGKDVLTYSGIELDPRDADGKTLIKDDMLSISRGYISLQSESHPCEFRNIEIQVIKP
jgi:3-keto-disaccharide hydrolase